MKIGTDFFSGEIPKASSRLLPDSASQYALNCDLQSGILKPIKDKTEVYDVNESGKETIFRWKYSTDDAIGRTVTNTTVSNWTSVSDGSILLTTAGNSYEIIGIDFTSATTMVSVAGIIQAYIRTATSNLDTCTWSTDHFVFNFDENPFISMGGLYGTGTDITNTDYMNVRGDIVTKVTDWVTADDFTYYFNSPIVDDQYQRLYSENSTTGEYRVRSNDYQFTSTDREMILDIPETTILESVSEQVFYNEQVESPAIITERLFTSNWSSITYESSIGYAVQITEIDSDQWAVGDSVSWNSISTSAYFTGTISSFIGEDVSTVGSFSNFNVSYITSNSRPSTSYEIGVISVTHEDVEAGASYPELEGIPADGDTYDRSYVWTYVYENGEESPISLISDEAKIYPETFATLTTIGDTSPPTGAVYKNIYCTDGSLWRFVTQIDASTTTFTDNLSSTALGEEMLVYQNAPSNMSGIVLSSQGFAIGWRGNDIYFSESFLPYSWDDRWSLNFPYDIVSCVAMSGEIYVLTTGVPYLLTGYHPEELTSSALPFNQACSNQKAVTKIGNTVLYATPDGLASLNGSNAKLITSDIYTRDEWQELSPSTMNLGTHDNEVYIFNGTETHVLNVDSIKSGIVRLDIVADAVYEDIEEDLLYVYNSTDEKIYSLRTNSSDSTFTWKSKEYDFKKRTHLSCAKVIADSYDNLTLNIYVNGGSTVATTKSISNSNAFKLPRHGSYSTLAYELVGTDNVHSIQIGTNMRELEG